MQTTNKHPKQSFTGNSLYLFAAKFFPALATFLVWMYCSKILSAKDYGHYQSFWIQLATLTAFATIGFPIFILTYSPAAALGILRALRSKQIVVYSLFLSLLAAIFSFIQLAENDISFFISVSFFILFALCMLADAMLLAVRSFKAVISINVLYATGFAFLHWLNVSAKYSLQNLIIQLLFLLCCRLLISLISIRASSKMITHETTEEPYKVYKLWLQLGINDMIQVLFRWIDKFILSFILAKEIFAVYTNATIEIAFLPLVFSAVSSAAVQHWAQQQSMRNTDSQISLLHYSSRILSSIVFPLFFFLLFFREEFLISIFSEKYLSGVWIFIAAQLVLPVRAYPFSALLQSHHRGDIINKGALIDFVLACVLMYPLYLLMGLPGVALSFVISTYWQAGYYLVQSSKLLQVPVFSLFPLGLLLRKFALYALIFGTAFYLLKQFTTETKVIFWTGILLLALTGAISLLYEWNKNKKSDEHTSQ